MQYTCALRELEIFGYHGLYDEEKIIGGVFVVDVEIVSELPDHIVIENINQVHDYEKILALVRLEMNIRQDLIETVAQRIFNGLLALFPDLLQTRVSIAKKNPAGAFKSGKAVVTFSK